MDLLRVNQSFLQKQLADEPYCKVSNSSGALYSVINVDCSMLGLANTEELVLCFYKEEVNVWRLRMS